MFKQIETDTDQSSPAINMHTHTPARAPVSDIIHHTSCQQLYFPPICGQSLPDLGHCSQTNDLVDSALGTHARLSQLTDSIRRVNHVTYPQEATNQYPVILCTLLPHSPSHLVYTAPPLAQSSCVHHSPLIQPSRVHHSPLIQSSRVHHSQLYPIHPTPQPYSGHY